jgi:uncharacterized protein YfaS (alpha-2-macroglobulin family)
VLTADVTHHLLRSENRMVPVSDITERLLQPLIEPRHAQTFFTNTNYNTNHGPERGHFPIGFAQRCPDACRVSLQVGAAVILARRSRQRQEHIRWTADQRLREAMPRPAAAGSSAAAPLAE